VGHVEVATVAPLLRRANPNTTMVYARLGEDELQVATDRIGVP
jgi:hypothetical protein